MYVAWNCKENMSQIYPHHPVNATECHQSTAECTQVLTIWKKALFFSGTGFMIFDSSGNLLFRVENWTPNVTTQLLLMDATGNPLLLLRKKVVSLHQRWEGFICNKADGHGSARRRLFSIKRSSIIPATTSIDVFVGSSSSDYLRRHADYHIEGSFRDRACAIYNRSRTMVAQNSYNSTLITGTDRCVYKGNTYNWDRCMQVKRKHESCNMMVDKDVFRLEVYPGFDPVLVTSWIILLHHINREYLSHLTLPALKSTLRSHQFPGKADMGRKDEHSNVD